MPGCTGTEALGGLLAVTRVAAEPGVMMPELGRSVVHDEGLALVREYIARMQAH